MILRSVFGVDFSGYRMSTIQRRVERRLALFNMDSVEQYVDYLRRHPDEVQELYHDILIMVTEFFASPRATSCSSPRHFRASSRRTMRCERAAI